jgi:hypothetical protein
LIPGEERRGEEKGEEKIENPKERKKERKMHNQQQEQEEGKPLKVGKKRKNRDLAGMLLWSPDR